ncbi:MAG: NUDIX domain-containing protein [Clostridia bacterium]|nr:NUDIX domain-containing protein [Clostridia bacterium]
MNQATRLIIEEDDHLIFIKRRKKVNGGIKEFYVLPGGFLDDGESFEEAGVREAFEELNVKVEMQELFTEIYLEELDKNEKYFFARVLSGKIKNGTGEEFQNQSIDSPYGTYEVVKLNKKELGSYTILPVEIKDLLVATYV